LIVHGFLHLIGHDHATEAEAVVMERLETAILAGIGVADPYADDNGSEP
jgi:probable rRNA maturation factor